VHYALDVIGQIKFFIEVLDKLGLFGVGQTEQTEKKLLQIFLVFLVSE
jgi:hypothetical protein